MIHGFRKFNLSILLLLIFNFAAFSQEEVQKQNEEEKIVIPEYENIIDSSKFLHLHSYKDENVEHLILHKNARNKKTASYYSNNRLKRFFYNDSLKLELVEFWTTGKTVKESALVKKQLYTYYQDDSELSFLMEEHDFVKKQIERNYYNKADVLVKKDIFSFFETDDSKISEPRIEYEFSYGYDAEGRLISEKEKHFIYRTAQTKRVLKTVSRRNTYEYLRADSPPVTSFYEDDVLRMRTVYSSENSYVQYVYFDNDNYVKVQYKDGKKILEKFYAGGKEL